MTLRIESRALRSILLAATAAAVVAATACSRTADTSDAESRIASTGYAGVALPAPVTIPSITLRDVNGDPYDLRARSAGAVTLLFFGYTHCPDICPVHLTNISDVLRTFSWSMRDSIHTVFVTTDPARDTPQRLQSWLGAIDPSIIGLWGTPDELARAQAEVNLPAAVRLPGGTDSTYSVGHAGQVIAFSPDGVARYVYPFGTRQADWAHDLPLLLRETSGE
jgi:protein SCO1/2